MTPTPPTNYMLRELTEVGLTEPVSWWPQTLGWKLLLVLFIGYLGYRLYHKLRFWWRNRYRQEAIVALQGLSVSDPRWPSQMMKIVKIVMVYLEPKNAALYGVPLILQMENYHRHSQFLSEQQCKLWIQCLEDPRATLPDFTLLSQGLTLWLTQHQVQEYPDGAA
ncbi:DUF4381 domain-containing protein [Shewanella sp. A25]|nr:DUF4381 domain-containing protein [Shewanella shenzhenensis]